MKKKIQKTKNKKPCRNITGEEAPYRTSKGKKENAAPSACQSAALPCSGSTDRGNTQSWDLVTDICSRLRRPWPLLWQESLSYTAKTRAEAAFWWFLQHDNSQAVAAGSAIAAVLQQEVLLRKLPDRKGSKRTSLILQKEYYKIFPASYYSGHWWGALMSRRRSVSRMRKDRAGGGDVSNPMSASALLCF